MKPLLFVSVCAVALSVSAGPAPVSTRDSGPAAEGVPFIDPSLSARSACGRTPAAARERRAAFLRIAAAIAAEPAPILETPRFRAAPGIAYAISANPQAQRLFDAGLAHMWNFNHGEAIAAFQAAQSADPACAMCDWAEALALGPNINAPMDPEANTPAIAALERAQSKADAVSGKEKALIDAMATRYAAHATADRAALDGAFADAMDAVARTYPDDDFIAILAAEANMDAQPWDYWEADGRTPKGRTARTIELIESVLGRTPDHIAAIHLYIHITEATTNPFRALAYADRLDDLSAGYGHLIHMPSHTYYRVGQYKASMDVNVAAAAADEAFIAGGHASPFYEFGYYVHNVHFLMTSAQMAGDARLALETADKLDAKLPLQKAIDIPFSQPIKAAPLFARAQFAAPVDILALEKPEGAPFLEGAWRYARGEALLRDARLADAIAEADALDGIRSAADLSMLTELNIPGPDVLSIASLTLRARISAAEGDLSAAMEMMENAVALQEGLNYTEPPYWYYPAKQTLAAMALQAGETERAEQLFVEALAESPNNGWVLYGLGEAYAAQGDKRAAKYARTLMKNAWAGDAKSLRVERL